MNEQEYLRNYNPDQYPRPLFMVDAVLFSYFSKELHVLLVRRSAHPCKDQWGLPGGFVDISSDRCIEDTMYRKLQEKTGIRPPYLEQLTVSGGSGRDPRGWSVSACYYALMGYQESAVHVSTVSDARWFPCQEAAERCTAFDHCSMIEEGRKRLKQKALYSIVPAFALDQPFTLPELQALHECLVGKTLAKKSFRRRIEQAGLLEDTGEKRMERGRPAVLYRLKPEAHSHTFNRNLEA